MLEFWSKIVDLNKASQGVESAKKERCVNNE